jgi:hypothetical protein
MQSPFGSCCEFIVKKEKQLYGRDTNTGILFCQEKNELNAAL